MIFACQLRSSGLVGRRSLYRLPDIPCCCQGHSYRLWGVGVGEAVACGRSGSSLGRGCSEGQDDSVVEGRSKGSSESRLSRECVIKVQSRRAHGSAERLRPRRACGLAPTCLQTFPHPSDTFPMLLLPRSGSPGRHCPASLHGRHGVCHSSSRTLGGVNPALTTALRGSRTPNACAV
jgi:hypothetical protein